MTIRPTLLFLSLGLLLGVHAADAAPVDTKVGDVRAVFAKDGTVIRVSPSTLAKPVASLPYGTQVEVLEMKLPWLRVQARNASAPTGWLRAWKTVEASALGANPAPPHLSVRGSAGASSREVSAAGRQLDADTERRWRATRRDLVAAYRAVDAMEAATQALHPADALAFIDEGNLGRRGRDYARPGRVKPSQRRANRSSGRRSGGVGGLLGRLGGEAARRLGASEREARVAESLIGSATEYVDQVKKSFTPEQEYFLGRAVAAQAIARYGVDRDANRRRYVRLVGEAVVRLSSRLPANVGGYHFEVLDSDEVNGVSGPGGFVLVTRGAVEACQSEAELAGILAHELAHIRDKHGERLVRQSKEFPIFVKGLAGAAGAAAGTGSQFTQGLVRFFGQVAEQAAGNAIDHGYGRDLEFAADREGTHILYDVFYEPDGMQTFLARLKHGHGHHGGGTHAAPAMRAQALTPVLARLPFAVKQEVLVPRQQRFAREMGR